MPGQENWDWKIFLFTIEHPKVKIEAGKPKEGRDFMKNTVAVNCAYRGNWNTGYRVGEVEKGKKAGA